MPWSPVEVLAGVPANQAERATALLRAAGIPVNLRKVVEGGSPACWLHVDAADEAEALRLLAAHSFPVATIPPDRPVLLQQPTGAAPGDDVWALLTQVPAPRA